MLCGVHVPLLQALFRVRAAVPGLLLNVTLLPGAVVICDGYRHLLRSDGPGAQIHGLTYEQDVHGLRLQSRYRRGS